MVRMQARYITVLEAHGEARLRSKDLFVLPEYLKKKLFTLPEETKRVYIHDDSGEWKENGGLRWGFLVYIASR